MAPRHLVAFTGFRQFDHARAEANDALWALILGTRLSKHLLDAHVGSDAYLPAMYPAVRNISRLNLKSEQAQRLLEASESHVASMGIPYVWTAYEGLVKSVVDLLKIGGSRKPTKSETGRGVPGLQDYVASVSTPAFTSDDLQLTDVVREIRNAITHEGGAPSKRLSSSYQSLSVAGRTQWMKYSGRDLGLSGEKIDVLAGELVASLAITKHMAYCFNETVRTSLSQRAWTVAIVEDFHRNYPAVIPRDPTLRAKKVTGWNRMYYRELSIPNSDVLSELDSRYPG